MAVGLPQLGFFRRYFGKWIALSQYGFPFSIGRYATSVGRFRALARQSRFGASAGYVRVPTSLAMTLAWPFGAFASARRTCKLARARGRQYGLRQFTDMYWLALRHSIPPLEYALYRFEDPARRREMQEYIYWNDLPGLTAVLMRAGVDNRDVQDKDRFAEICAENNFPHVNTLAVFERGKQTFPTTPFVPDAPILWTKSLRLKGGAGGAKWIKDGPSYRDIHGRCIAADKLADIFREQDCIVQPFIENHSDIMRVTNGALAALRIVTGVNSRGGA